MKNIRFKFGFLGLIIPVWGSLVGTGMFWLQTYGNTPSATAAAPEHWPATAQLDRQVGMPSLLVFVHPHCPCSQATIRELERLTAQLGAALPTHVVFLHPTGVPPNWHQTSLWSHAQEIPGVTVVEDVGGGITGQFGVATSGQALMYDADGRLQFSGGLTPARGHSGDSVGRDTILSLSRSGRSTPVIKSQCSCVFGCPLFENATPTRELFRGQK